MPGLTPHNMNGYDYGRGGQYMVNGGGAYGAYPDYPRERENLYRQDDYVDDLYRRPMKNGGRFGNDFADDQNSITEYGGRDPAFELDHLATYSAGRSGVRAAEGLSRLRTMENTTGIWTMRCVLIVERRSVTVLDKNTGEELERFPIDCVTEPTAVIKNDRRDIYNNLILFTVVEDPRKKNSNADLHIFQSIKVPPQDIVDEIIAAKEGRGRINPGQRIPPPPHHPAPEPPGRYDPYNFHGMSESIRDTNFAGGASFMTRTNRPTLADSAQNEVLEKNVQLLNHCFDDIERFVARLQQAAEAYKELERRKRARGNKGKFNRQSGDGMLSFRARPPPAADFIDILQKFKFSFNLLAKLKSHIHDPNAPELVHFLFTPLSLIYEASRDPIHGNRDLANEAIAPLLTHEAKQLLLNCLTSKEIDLWQTLGPKWTTSRDVWPGRVPQFSPTFYDGWRPSPSDIDEPHFQPPERPSYREPEDLYSHKIYETRPTPRVPSPRPPSPQPIRQAQPGSYMVDNSPEYNEPPLSERSVHRPEPSRPQPIISDNNEYLHELRSQGIVAYEALADRQGKNQKEINVKKGDILQVLEDTRKWWKVRNCRGEVGFAPYTILSPIKDDGSRPEPAGERISGHYNSYMENSTGVPVGPSSSDQLNRHRQPKREDYYEDELENTTPSPTNLSDRPSPRQPSPKLSTPSPVDRSAFQPPMPNGKPRSKEKTHQDILHDELRQKMNAKGILQQPTRHRPPGPEMYITRYSHPEEVLDWLEAKGFSDRCIQTFEGYSGQEIFQLKKRDFEHVIGHEEAVRLEGQLTIQKKTSGFETRGGSELRAILQRQKERADTRDRDEAMFGQPPSFRPVTPQSLEDDDSDDTSEDPHLGDTGKTLRDLLIRQRKKIMENNVFDNPTHND